VKLYKVIPWFPRNLICSFKCNLYRYVEAPKAPKMSAKRLAAIGFVAKDDGKAKKKTAAKKKAAAKKPAVKKK
jgi:hypothetical protein